MTLIRLFSFILVIFTLSLVWLSVDARSHTNPGRQRRRLTQQHEQERRGRRSMQEDESDNSLVTRGKGGGGDSLPPELPTLPPIPFSTKSPSRSSSSAPSRVPKGQDSPTGELTPSPVPVPGPIPVPPPETTTTAPSVSLPATTTTSMPSSQELPIEGGTTAPSTSGLVSPTEMAEEESRTRALLPFSLDVTDQPGVDELRLVIQDFLYQRLFKSFSNLESILLTVTNNEPQRRKLGMVPRLPQQQQQRRRLQEDAATAAEGTKTFNFTGGAMFFLDQGTIPTEVEVQRAQLEALEDFHRLNQFISTEGGYSWQIDTIALDGMIINKDGMVVGDSGEMVNEGDTMVQESYQSQGNDSDSNALAISLSVIGIILVLVGILVGLLVYRRRNTNADDEPKETYQELIRSVDDLPKELEPSPNDKNNAMNISFESATVATTSFDSVLLSTPEKGLGPGSPSSMDWNRVFALSQSPVEETMAEVFEPKTLAPPKTTKVHEIVTLAPVAETGRDNEMGQDGDGEDSYGYDEGHQDDFVTSSPVAPPSQVRAGDDNDDFVPRGDHYNQDRDLTIDLSDFNIDPDNDPK